MYAFRFYVVAARFCTAWPPNVHTTRPSSSQISPRPPHENAALAADVHTTRPSSSEIYYISWAKRSARIFGTRPLHQKCYETQGKTLRPLTRLLGSIFQKFDRFQEIIFLVQTERQNFLYPPPTPEMLRNPRKNVTPFDEALGEHFSKD